MNIEWLKDVDSNISMLDCSAAIYDKKVIHHEDVNAVNTFDDPENVTVSESIMFLNFMPSNGESNATVSIKKHFHSLRNSVISGTLI